MAVNTELLLFIEPENAPSEKPIIDELTKKMTASFRKSQKGAINDYQVEGQGYEFIHGGGYFGTHDCSCGAVSHARCSLLPNGEMTNDNCIHYLAHHREEVTEEQLIRVANLSDGQEVPDKEELGKGMEMVSDTKKPMTRQAFLDSLKNN